MLYGIYNFMGNTLGRMLPGMGFVAGVSGLSNYLSWGKGAAFGVDAVSNVARDIAIAAPKTMAKAVFQEGASRLVPGGAPLAKIIMDGVQGAFDNVEPDVSPFRAGAVAVASTAAGIAANAVLPGPLGFLTAYGASQAIQKADKAFLYNRRGYEQQTVQTEMNNTNEKGYDHESLQDSDLMMSFMSLS
jgi:hypothetical protein